VQFNPAASSGANGAVTPGGSTGPFSGGSSLTATIAARMFETPGALTTIGGAGTSSTGTAVTGVTPATPSAGTSTLNNS
jgi:hypothetical protein